MRVITCIRSYVELCRNDGLAGSGIGAGEIRTIILNGWAMQKLRLNTQRQALRKSVVLSMASPAPTHTLWQAMGSLRALCGRAVHYASYAHSHPSSEVQYGI